MTASRKISFGLFDYASFLIYMAYAAGSVAVPVALVFLARDLGFNLEEGGMGAGGLLHLGRTAPMVVSMLLCGFAAGFWGARRSLGASVVLMALGMGLCAVAPSYGILFLALMLAGLGEGVIEGLGTPFVQKLHADEPGRYVNIAHSFWSVGVFATVLIAGALLSLGVSWRLIVGGVALLGLLPALLLLLPSGAKHGCAEHPEPLRWRTVWGHAMEICRIPRFWLFFAAMFVAGGGEFCLTFWCASYIQLNLAASAWAGGLGTAFFAAGMVVGRLGCGYLVAQRHLKHLILFAAIGGIAVTLLLPLSSNLWLFFFLLLLSGLATAPFWPSVQSYCADCLPKTDVTMLMILLSCAGVPGCGFFTWLMGWMGNLSGSLNAAFYLVPACYLILALLIGLDWLFHKESPPSASKAGI
jgi:MFS family permease